MKRRTLGIISGVLGGGSLCAAVLIKYLPIISVANSHPLLPIILGVIGLLLLVLAAICLWPKNPKSPQDLKFAFTYTATSHISSRDSHGQNFQLPVADPEIDWSELLGEVMSSFIQAITLGCKTIIDCYSELSLLLWEVMSSFIQGIREGCETIIHYCRERSDFITTCFKHEKQMLRYVIS